jgi:four helix bundle protein
MEKTRRNDLHKLDVQRCALGEAELRSQMKRASRSVPHNIGEGVGERGQARAASYEVALGEAKEIIVALDCVEIDQLAPTDEIVAAQDLADRVSAMLTKLIRRV